MPDRSKLEVGDKIRLLAVPAADLAQRDREIARGLPLAGWTADTIERILAQDPVVVIDHIDEYGLPWFEYLLDDDEGHEEHSMAIMEDDSWEYA